jgi:hypothetical protein
MKPSLPAAAFVLSAAATVAAAPEAVFSHTYVRGNGPPVTATDTFSVCDAAGQFTLVLVNGPGGLRRVSSGHVSVNGVEVIHPSDLNQQVDRIERPLANVAADNTVEVTLAGGPGGAIALSVMATQSCGIRITSPANGSTVTGPEVLVQGTMPASFGADVAVTVNGTRGFAGNGSFAALVRVDTTVTALTAVASDANGTPLDDDTVAIAVEPGPLEAAVRLSASPAVGLAPLSVELTLMSTVAVGQIALDQDGDGTVDFQGPSLEGLRFTYAQPGVFLAAATVTNGTGSHKATAIVQVYDPATLEALLQAKWAAMKDALRRGDVEAALRFIVASQRDRYRRAFELIAADLPQIDTILGAITLADAWATEVTFTMPRSDAGVQKTFEVRFGVDADGIWRVRAF